MTSLKAALTEQLAHTLTETNFSGLGPKYEGKVRDVYRGDDHLVVITTDRVSAFDHVLGTVPFKGQILTEMAHAGFEATRDIVPNHVLRHPDPNVLIARPCTPYPIEFVVRGYITGSLWRDYQSGAAATYGIDFPTGLRKDERFSAPVLTPSTKAERGAHDQPISKQAIVERQLMTEAQLEAAEAAAFALYARGLALAEARGLILVDTKYELGEDADGRLTAIDEIHTPDSSRYWRADSYEARFEAGRPQAMLDKENLRQWLIEQHGYSGQGAPPALSDEIRVTLAQRYAELYALMLGRSFVPEVGSVKERVHANLVRGRLLAAD